MPVAHLTILFKHLLDSVCNCLLRHLQQIGLHGLYQEGKDTQPKAHLHPLTFTMAEHGMMLLEPESMSFASMVPGGNPER